MTENEEEQDSRGASLYDPVLSKALTTFKFIKDIVWGPFNAAKNWFTELQDFELFCFGCFIPILAIALIQVAVHAIIVVPLLICLIILIAVMAMTFVIIGILPAFISTAIVTAVALWTMPINIYHHYVLMYRTKKLTILLKFISLLIFPVVHLLQVPIIFATCIISFIPSYIFLSLAGYPHQLWKNLKEIDTHTWKNLRDQVEECFKTDDGLYIDHLPSSWKGRITNLFDLPHFETKTPTTSPKHGGPWLFALIVSQTILALVAYILVAISFLLIGIWPAFINSMGVFAISIYGLPLNIYTHLLVTWRTIMLSKSLKLFSFILFPIIHILVPACTLIVALFGFTPYYMYLCLGGYPLEPWGQIEEVHEEAYKYYVTKVAEFRSNYGDESGIPNGWDGTIYGNVFDPVIFIFSLILYVVGVAPVSLAVLCLFVIKAVPLFMGIVEIFAKSHNPFESYWSLIKSYNKLLSMGTYWKYLKGYGTLVKDLSLCNLYKIVKSYVTECSPLKVKPKEICNITLICTFIPLVSVIAMWIIGLGLALTMPPITFLLVFGIWLALWPFVILIPPTAFIIGEILVLIVPPVVYLLVWCCVLLAPWVLSTLGASTGPLIALTIPFNMLAYHYRNPVQTWDNAWMSLVKILDILKTIDRSSGKISVCNFTIFHHEGDEVIDQVDHRQHELAEMGAQETNRAMIRTDGRKADGPIKYWDLFTERCKQESINIQQNKWLMPDDIISFSSTATVAIPSVTIVQILSQTMKKNEEDKSILIYWNEDNQCRNSNRNFRDNISNVFYPQLLHVKESLKQLEEAEYDNQVEWIKASLCDGEDEQTDDLKKIIEDEKIKEAKSHKKAIQIKSEVMNIVLALHRVKEFQTKFPEIFSVSIENEDRVELEGLNETTAVV